MLRGTIRRRPQASGAETGIRYSVRGEHAWSALAIRLERSEFLTADEATVAAYGRSPAAKCAQCATFAALLPTPDLPHYERLPS